MNSLAPAIFPSGRWNENAHAETAALIKSAPPSGDNPPVIGLAQQLYIGRLANGDVDIVQELSCRIYRSGRANGSDITFTDIDDASPEEWAHFTGCFPIWLKHCVMKSEFDSAIHQELARYKDLFYELIHFPELTMLIPTHSMPDEEPDPTALRKISWDAPIEERARVAAIFPRQPKSNHEALAYQAALEKRWSQLDELYRGFSSHRRLHPHTRLAPFDFYAIERDLHRAG